MKKFFFFVLFITLFFSSAFAATFDVNISGLSYDPATITVNVGDVVNIQASGSHTLQQVSQATWDLNGNTPLPGGFNSSSNFQLTITAGMAGTTIYYVCVQHASLGMKGRIIVNVVAGIPENISREFNFTVYPNPIVADAWLNISVKKAGRISLTLFDVKGRIVKQIIDMNMQQGEMNLRFDASKLQKGNYVLLMRTVEGTMHRQIVVQ